MKDTTYFPFDVIRPNEKLELMQLDHNEGYLVYNLKVPGYILAKPECINFQESIQLVAEINCSATMYREIIRSKDLNEIILQIDRSSIYDSFHVDVLIIFTSNVDWSNQTIEKGMPLAHLGSFKIDLENRAQGLISFIGSEADTVENSFTDNTINVRIPQYKFDWLVSNQHNPLIKRILSSQLGQIALIEACQRIKDNSNDHLLWQQEIKNRWKLFDQNDKEFPDDSEIIPFVNSILDQPSDGLLTFLIENLDKDE